MKRALLRPLLGGLLAISVLASSSCVRHECDSHPERCGPRDLLLLSAPLVKQAASSELRFEIQNLSPALSLAAISAELKQGSEVLPLQLTRQATTNIFTTTVQGTDLSRFETGSATLQVRADTDTGQLPVPIIYRRVAISEENQLLFRDLPTPLNAPKAKRIDGYNGQYLYVLYEGVSKTTSQPARQLVEYTYNTLQLLPSLRSTSFSSELSINTLAAVSGNLMTLAIPEAANPARMTLQTCSIGDAVQPCSSSVAQSLGTLQGLAGELGGGTLAVALQGGLKFFTYRAVPPLLTLSEQVLPSTPPAPALPLVALGALDRKSGADLVVIDQEQATGSVYLQDASGLRLDTTRSQSLTAALAGQGRVDALTVGDVDGDGLQDLVIAHGNKPELLLWQEDGTLRSVAMPTTIAGTIVSLLVMPIDRDAAADIAAVTQDNQLALFFNQLDLPAN